MIQRRPNAARLSARAASSSPTALIVLWLAGWTLFAFGGTYRWTTIPLLVGAVLLAVVERPRPARRPYRAIDLSLIACLAVVLVQLVPLPPAIRQAISPAAVAFDRSMRLDMSSPLAGPWRPLSIDPIATAWILALATALVVVFWCARAAFARGGLRTVARSIAWFGLAVAAFAIVQHATAPTLLYWYWRPFSKSATPYGPFVNKNDLACWLVMGIPLTVGYAIARVRARHGRDGGTANLEQTLDSTTLWLAGSACLMMGALLVSLSRSGITAAGVALAGLVWMSREHIDRRRAAWLLAALASMVVIGAVYANMGALASRLDEVLEEGVGGRRAIWRDTWTMATDFWRVGVGAGAYVRGMLVYQQGSRVFYYNHAHDEYLQILAEGGALLGVPATIAALAVMRGVWRRLGADRSPAYWMRAGAASAMIAVAVQSVWDVGLQMPANGVLFALLAGIALHDTDSADRPDRVRAVGPPHRSRRLTGSSTR